MLITKYIEIDMAHRVPNHKSKCRNLHGHRYRVTVGVDDKVIITKGASSEGMVIDFSDIKTILMEYIDAPFDHNTMIYTKDPILPFISQIQKYQEKNIAYVTFVPTAENIAEMFFNILKPLLKQKGIRLKFVEINETPSSSAKYEN